ncbi:MAG: hypothetical protein JOZ65_12570 [Chloroflexi bacterium]|nr:hypothetical protein [Chloroflexota bacterium]
MNDHVVEIDQIENGRVVLTIPSLRVIVIGRTLEEARAWTRSALAYRGVSTCQCIDAPATKIETARPTNSNAA